MKKEFIGFYEPTKAEVDKAWKDGTFAFDANALLNLYRYSEATRKDFLAALKAVQSRLFLPYQAALEFHRNRIWIVDSLQNAYSNLQNLIKENFVKILNPQLNQFKKHPAIDVESILKLQEEYLEKVSLELNKQKGKHPDFKSKDYVLEELTASFENYVGKDFTKIELKKLYEDGRERFADSIPPGFLDNKKKSGERQIYGDLIVWKQLIAYSKSKKGPLIFVTDDRKEDWWTIENGKTIRPREELIKEFFDNTGVRILIYNADQFLKFAKEKKLVPKLNQKTINEVKDVRISDEKQNAFLDTVITAKKYASVNNAKGILDPKILDLMTHQNTMIKNNPLLNTILNSGSQSIFEKIYTRPPYKSSTLSDIITDSYFPNPILSNQEDASLVEDEDLITPSDLIQTEPGANEEQP